MIFPSSATSVSAASTILSGYARATDTPFRIAFHVVSSRNVRSRWNFSATRGETVSNSKPASESNAARLGEQDASTSKALARTTVGVLVMESPTRAEPLSLYDKARPGPCHDIRGGPR